MPLGNGESFAGYTIMRLLGSGAMGEVYLVKHPRLPRQDALKILPAHVSADTDFRDRFNREADLAATFDHPHIVGVHDRGEFDGQLWISMDYIEGADAAQLMRTWYPSGMPAADACAVVTAMAGALDYAHQRGLLHRDVKPANILLTDPDDDGERRVLLADFGIARQHDDMSGLTATNMMAGTANYAAPEQLMGAEIDGRADQYSLAATAFHLLSGGAPFQHSNPVAIASQHLSAAPPKLSDRRPELAHLDQVLFTALAEEPGERFGRCRDFAKALTEQAASDSETYHSGEAGLTVAAPIAGSETQLAAVSTAPGGSTQRAVPKSLPAADDRPPSEAESPPTGANEKRRTRSLILVAAAIAVVITAAAVIDYRFVKNNTVSKPEASKPAPPVAVLDGTYRLDFDWTKETSNGTPESTGHRHRLSRHPDTGPPSDWWAFRSSCGSTGCVATGTMLDEKNHQVAGTPPHTADLHFVNGHWQRTPFQTQDHQARCLGADEKIAGGEQTDVIAWSAEPQPDGTLRGVWSNTVLTTQCGLQGTVWQVPLVATRTDDLPPTVTVADPAIVSCIPTTSTPAPAVTSITPVLDGTYHLVYRVAMQTANGRPTTGGPNITYWYAIHSLCVSTGCSATASRVKENNLFETFVLHFNQGRWQNTPYLSTTTCPGRGTTTSSETVSWSIEPQLDGTLRGDETETLLSNECGNRGTVYRTPFSATRTGDVSSSVVLPDPALFEPRIMPAPTSAHS